MLPRPPSPTLSGPVSYISPPPPGHRVCGLVPAVRPAGCSKFTQTLHRDFVDAHDVRNLLREEQYVTAAEINSMKLTNRSNLGKHLARCARAGVIPFEPVRKLVEDAFGGDLMLMSTKHALKEQRKVDRIALSTAGQQLVQHLGLSGVAPELPIVVEDSGPAGEVPPLPIPWIRTTNEPAATVLSSDGGSVASGS